jgi:L-threonylcarbamoyladenylate synthase
MTAPPDPPNALIQRAAALLRDGGVVAIPTETVYGLGANALNVTAVARIFAIKGRPHFDPLIVHVPDLDAAAALVTHMPPAARKLAEAFWPGPLTLVLPKADCVPDLVTSGLPSVAVRVPSHPVAQRLLRAAGVPVAAPSANRFGRVSPTTAQHVRDELGDAVDAIVDGGPCTTGVESTVISFLDDIPRLLRPGGLPVERIEAILGPVARPAFTPPTDQALASPGMLKSHYAPTTPITLVDSLDAALPLASNSTALLALRVPRDVATRFARVEQLSATGDMTEAAANLFAAMRRLDDGTLTHIVAVKVPEQGLGLAINDRLTRAAAK